MRQVVQLVQIQQIALHVLVDITGVSHMEVYVLHVQVVVQYVTHLVHVQVA